MQNLRLIANVINDWLWHVISQEWLSDISLPLVNNWTMPCTYLLSNGLFQIKVRIIEAKLLIFNFIDLQELPKNMVVVFILVKMFYKAGGHI